MSCHDGAGPRMQPRKLLDAASTVLHFAHQCSQTNVIQQLQLARNDILVVVDTLRLLSTHPHVYTMMHTHADELVDAVSYKCTQIIKGASPRQAVEPLRVYIVPEHELAPVIACRKQLFNLIRSTCTPTTMTCTIIGLVSCISAATSIPYGLCYHCASCKLPVLVRTQGNKGHVCLCGAPFDPTTPLQHMHTVHMATIRLPGAPICEDVEVQIAAKLKCPVQNAERLLKPMPLQTLMNLVRAAVGHGGAQPHVTWYVALATLISAVAVGEGQRLGKVHNNESHRCQVHLLWVGSCLSTCTRSFVCQAAKICSPVVKVATLNDQLEPRASTHADGVMRFQAGKLVEGSQGIVLVELAGMPQANLHRLHAYTRDCTSTPESKTFVSSPPMSNTATCWAMVDTQTLLRNKDATDMEKLELSAGGLAVPNFDLLLKAGSSDIHEDWACDGILGLVDKHPPTARSAGRCCTILRNHLLKACAADRPAMTDECIQVLQSYYGALRTSYANSGHVHHTTQTLSVLIRLCLASARLHLRDTTDVVDCMVAIRLVEESMDVKCSGGTEKMFGAELHDLADTADNECAEGIDRYFEHLGQSFPGKGRDHRMRSEE